MSGLAGRLEHAPALEHLEADADRVREEIERLLAIARDEARAVQDLDAELDGIADDPGGAFAAREKHRYRLRAIARQFNRAQAALVHPEDERAHAARQMAAWCDEADRDDYPWTAAVA